jgi:hypothetical protein
MASDAVVRTFPPFIRWSLISTTVVVGAGYAFGPPSFSSATSFDALKSIPWLPFPFWGFAFMFCGIMMASTRLVGYGLGVMIWGVWGSALLLAALDGKLSGWGGLIHPFFMVAICGYEVFRWGQLRLARARARQRDRSG